MRNENTFLNQHPLGISSAKNIKIGRCLTKLRPAAAQRVFFIETQCIRACQTMVTYLMCNKILFMVH